MSLASAMSEAFAGRENPAAVPAAAAAVLAGREEVVAAWGAETDTLFQAASISKPVAALVTLRLVAQDRLSLDVDVNEYLRSWRLPNAGWPPVTIRHVLGHSGALTVHGFAGYPQDAPQPSLNEVLEGLPPANTPAVRQDGPPGQQWRYSGGGYVLLQQLLEDVTGERFADLAADLVLRPAGMATATYGQPQPSQVAAAHTGGREVGWHVYPELAAAGLWCTPVDLVRLAQAIQASITGDDGALLPRKLAVEMVTPQTGGFGLGLWLSGDGMARRFSHGGGNHGYRCALIGTAASQNAADRNSVAVMTSSDEGDPVIASLLAVIPGTTSWPDLPARPVW
jgi:CubicO group peptidase (beta-lactamase class C family)